MKIGLVTFHASHNYGAILQAYALKKEIENIGYDCSIINYKTDKVLKDYRIFHFGSANSLKSYISICMNIFGLKSLKLRWDKFEIFAIENFNLTKRYKTVQDIQNENFEFDALICGSDQVWNPMGRSDAVYMLDFCNNKNILKIAYAPSFGKGDIPKERLVEYRNNIMKFDHLSARETSGANMIKALTGREARVVADPVFLLTKSDWDDSFMGMEITQPYILCYLLGIPPDIQKTIDYYKKMTNYKVVLIHDSYYSKVSAEVIIRDAGPKDFISLFSGASFIITTTFHGTAFSIINKIPFLSIENSNSDARVIDLLKKLNLFDRFVTVKSSMNSDLLNINYDNVETLIDEFIAESKEYLRNSLKL